MTTLPSFGPGSFGPRIRKVRPSALCSPSGKTRRQLRGRRRLDPGDQPPLLVLEHDAEDALDLLGRLPLAEDHLGEPAADTGGGGRPWRIARVLERVGPDLPHRLGGRDPPPSDRLQQLRQLVRIHLGVPTLEYGADCPRLGPSPFPCNPPADRPATGEAFRSHCRRAMLDGNDFSPSIGFGFALNLSAATRSIRGESARCPPSPARKPFG